MKFLVSMAPKRLSPRHSPEPRIENPELCCSALILHAAAFSTLKQMMGESDWRPTPSSSVAGSSIYKKEGILVKLGVSPTKENFKSHNFDFASSSASSCYQSHYSVPMKKKLPKVGVMINGEQDTVMSPSTSSSSNSSTMNAIIGGPNGTNVNCDFSTSNSSSSSGFDFKRSDYKRFTLPSIMTTSDTNSEFGEPIQLNQPIDYHLLYADVPAPLGMSVQQKIRRRNYGSVDVGVLEELEDSEIDEACTASPAEKDKFGSVVAAKELRQDARKIQMRIGYHPSVRRVASFTSPTKIELEKQQYQQQRERRGFFGKTLNFIRNKVDGSMSQSTLCPTREEVRSWQERMENLLENKYGCILFGEFLDKEYSRENLDFVLKCREYKKLFQNSKKNQKKIQKLAKDIFDNFLEDGAPQEVNLESTVKAATKKAFKDELEENTFSLAQNKIEQLLDNDKFRRFLKSSTYISLLDTVTKGSQLSIQSANPDVQFTDEVLTTPIAGGNEDTPIAPQNRTLRSSSAIENGSIHTITE
ncbi:hypothetical protein FO519_009294 [Halicephalobus sp. NKZ332]|nr:hypothetical protein FO519_009294 [Halicephalobus sp. NKZ332]